MSRPAAIAISLITVIALSAVFVATRPTTEMEKAIPDPTPTADKQQTPTVSDDANGLYVEFTEEIIGTTTGQKILFFHAPWCPQCRAIEQDILQQGVPGGVVIIKVDYDSHQDLRKKYGVTLQTTFVKIDSQGNPVAKYVAYNEPTLTSVKKNLML